MITHCTMNRIVIDILDLLHLLKVCNSFSLFCSKFCCLHISQDAILTVLFNTTYSVLISLYNYRGISYIITTDLLLLFEVLCVLCFHQILSFFLVLDLCFSLSQYLRQHQGTLVVIDTYQYDILLHVL